MVGGEGKTGGLLGDEVGILFGFQCSALAGNFTEFARNELSREAEEEGVDCERTWGENLVETLGFPLVVGRSSDQHPVNGPKRQKTSTA